ncbi:MAG: ABC transporter ATP-binding protein/permease [Lachnospiraceae bacterium]|nr:ABC transporter ATP-binding protein/permease [Lachnospiraceae bacterium]
MLQLKNIRKQYITGSLTQQALDDISVSFRDNEFVAILGPSGSGKTTMLNIIGGLDRYDSGELIINNVSTKKYKDRDWDSYRNHTIGFVFQSYNLIPHQTILSNVELALTISGVSAEERKKRAKEALDRVGLSEHIHKRPNQLSGGQMQRVAIARALVNDPEILLADEPTGALDSETSIQVMDLLKEVAKDRLVIMVTHNPELAEQYATRIVRLKDGKITSDTDPFDPASDVPAVHKNLGHAFMNFFTALALSFNNLRTKLTRTILVSFAGSIGIIGIALILSLSNGVNDYIKRTEEDTLKGYPLTITGMSLDIEGMIPQNRNTQEDDADVRERQTISRLFSTFKTNDLKSLKDYLEKDEKEIRPYASAIEYTYNLTPVFFISDKDGYRQVNPDTLTASMGYSSSLSTFASMFSSFSTRSMDSFSSLPQNEVLYKDQYEVKAGRWPEHYNELVVVISPSGYISDTYLYALNLKDASGLAALMAEFMAGNEVKIDEDPEHFHYSDFLGISLKLINPADAYTYDGSYHVWTDKSDDKDFMNALCDAAEDLTVVGVVQLKEGSETDNMMLSDGIYYPADLLHHCMQMTGESPIVQAQLADPTTDVITGVKFGENEKTSIDMKDLFSVDEDAMKEAFQFDTDGLDIDPSSAFDGMDFSDVDIQIDPSAFNIAAPNFDMNSMLSSIKIDFSMERMEDLFTSLLDGYREFASADPETDWENLPDALAAYLESEEAQETLTSGINEIIEEVGEQAITQEELAAFAEGIIAGYEAYAAENDIPAENRTIDTIREYLASEEGTEALRAGAEALIARLSEISIPEEKVRALGESLVTGYDAYAEENGAPVLEKFSESFEAYLNSEGAQKLISEEVQRSVDTSELEKRIAATVSQFSSSMASGIQNMITSVMQQVMNTVSQKIADAVPKMMESFTEELGNSFQFDQDAFAEAMGMNFSEEELRALLQSLMSNDSSTYSGNLQKFGYADEQKPTAINIYPYDFDGKTTIKAAIDAYNQRYKDAEEYDRMVEYTDFVGILMSSVTNIINAISYVLVAFVSISLVVSSIMIGVITYISVLERKKEIGILRAMGASKRNISQVFNAETIIIGFLAGLIGVLLTRLILIPANVIIQKLTGEDIYAFLPLRAAVILVILSVVLTMIGGLIPSRKAAKSDPVEALRTE